MVTKMETISKIALTPSSQSVQLSHCAKLEHLFNKVADTMHLNGHKYQIDMSDDSDGSDSSRRRRYSVQVVYSLCRFIAAVKDANSAAASRGGDELAKDLATSPVRYWAVVANALSKRLHL